MSMIAPLENVSGFSGNDRLLLTIGSFETGITFFAIIRLSNTQATIYHSYHLSLHHSNHFLKKDFESYSHTQQYRLERKAIAVCVALGV